jgi:predicted DNA repair protein MutK
LASGFFALLDDIAMLMDDVSTQAKVASKQTAGVLGDDLAVNASKASSFKPSRELPVIWAITKGSFLNKIIIIPIMLLLSFYFPKAITPILLLGGLYLSYEGAHGIWGFIFPHTDEDGNKKQISEKQKIKQAIITDFILSIEIVLIALSTVKDSNIYIQIGVVSIVALLATIGVYGIVAFLVRLDDIGFYIAKNKSKDSFLYKFGMFLVSLLPIIIKILSVVGVFAMLLVAGGIFMHNIEILHKILHDIPTLISELIIALLIGGVLMILIDGIKYFSKLILK